MLNDIGVLENKFISVLRFSFQRDGVHDSLKRWQLKIIENVILATFWSSFESQNVDPLNPWIVIACKEESVFLVAWKEFNIIFVKKQILFIFEKGDQSYVKSFLILLFCFFICRKLLTFC